MVAEPHGDQSATVRLHGNVSTVDAALVGRRVEIVFNPFDLTQVNIRYQGRPVGAGVPHIAADLGQIRLPGP